MLFIPRPSRFILLLVNNVTCPSWCTRCSKGATHLILFPLRDVPFRTHYVFQGCHSPLSVFLAWHSLYDALGATRVPLTSLCFPCATCPSGCTTCSKGATRLLADLVDIRNPWSQYFARWSWGRLRDSKEQGQFLIGLPLESSWATVTVFPHRVVGRLELGNC